MKLSKLIKTTFTGIILLIFSDFTFAEGASELSLRTTIGKPSPVLLLDTQADIKISGLHATVTLTQTYKNDSDQWVEGQYTLPLPDDSAITGLMIKTRNTTITGVVKEKTLAKKIYAKAKAAGKQAALLESERPNLFSTKVANIAPQSEIKIEVSYLQAVSFSQDLFSLRLPNTLTPRYVPRTYTKKEGELNQKHTIQNTGWSNTAGIAPPQTHALPNSHQIKINAFIQSGIILDTIDSPSHAIEWRESDEGYYIDLKNGSVPMNQDYVLTWQAQATSTPSAAVFSENLDNEHYLNLMVMPPQKSEATLPREVIFVIDSSGSMSGSSMRQAKASLHQALTHLSSTDYFNIIEFDDKLDTLFQDTQVVSNASLQSAKNFIDNMDADGGTEIEPALALSLKNAPKHGYLKQVVFLTDGSIGNEEEVFKTVSKNLGDTRLFTIGIGTAPNSYFMRKVASFGRGSFTHINDISNVKNQVSRLFQKLSNPVLKDLRIEWPNGVTSEIFPNPLPDLYLGEPLVAYAKLPKLLQDGQAITVHGSLLNQPWSRTITYNTGASSQGLSKLWARKKIEHLMDQAILGKSEDEIKKQVLPLALKHQLVSKYTSLIAVDKIISRPENSPLALTKVPNLIPKGNTMTIPYPQTATSAELRACLGILFLLLSASMLYQQRKSKEERAES